MTNDQRDLREIVANPEWWDDICPPECLNPTGLCDCFTEDDDCFTEEVEEADDV